MTAVSFALAGTTRLSGSIMGREGRDVLRLTVAMDDGREIEIILAPNENEHRALFKAYADAIRAANARHPTAVDLMRGG